MSEKENVMLEKSVNIIDHEGTEGVLPVLLGDIRHLIERARRQTAAAVVPVSIRTSYTENEPNMAERLSPH